MKCVQSCDAVHFTDMIYEETQKRLNVSSVLSQ